jgi:hypothetical protein
MQWLLRATMEVTTLEDLGKIDYQPKRWTSEQGAAAVVAAEEEPHSCKLE